MALIPCQCCGKQFPEEWRWYICNRCGFRICQWCLDRHQGQYSQGGGYKCSRCQFGQLRLDEGRGR
jgi:DNA-directed RNA polymerase subunit RPC12/RpoP